MTSLEHLLIAGGEPAGGAPTEDLIPALMVAFVLAAGLTAFGFAHRAGKTRLLSGGAAFGERLTGLPGWAAVAMGITGVSLLVAVFGFYWDVATHIDNGRDPGPFANPSHWLIIFGLAGIALAGILSVLVGSEESETSVRINDGWHAPLGGILLTVCGGIAVMGFPLDDVWHRLFGQDVTLWSPTHMQMVGGAALSTIALWITYVEASRRPVDAARVTAHRSLIEVPLAGALLIGLSAFQAEFDYSVPQFRMLYHPILLMLSAGIALVAARVRLGAGGALKAVGFFLLVRSIITVAVGPGMDHTILHFPLYLVEAVAVEVVARFVSPGRQITFGAIAGAAIGTFGLAAEWAWSHVWMTMEWNAALLPEGLIGGFLAGVAGGTLGGAIATALADRGAPRQRFPLGVGLATGVAVLVALFYPFPTNASLQGNAHFELTEVEGREGRWVNASIDLDPANVADDAEWFNVTAWQGGGSIVDNLEKVGPGQYRTTTPIPVHGEWKALVRLQRGSSIMAVPVFLPKDDAIPAPEVPAEESFTRPLMSDKKIVLREAKEVAPALTYAASSVLIAIATLWIALLGWALRRLASGKPAADGSSSLRRLAVDPAAR